MNAHLPDPLRAALAAWAPPVSARITTPIVWIPTLESCPEPGEVVMVSVAGKKRAIAACYDGMTWCYPSGHELEGIVTHYAERPMSVNA